MKKIINAIGLCCLLQGCQAQPVEPVISPSSLEQDFVHSTNSFAWQLFDALLVEDQNILISPMSIVTALTMSANGANQETLTQIEALLGQPVSELNKNLNSLMQKQTADGQMVLVNSLWVREDQSRVVIRPEFVQLLETEYRSRVFIEPFDQSTVTAVNQWVEECTQGLINKLIDDIPDEDVLYLINTLVVQADWQSQYGEGQVIDYEFTDWQGHTTSVAMLKSTENHYVENEQITGFIKAYANNEYAFVILLPKAGVSLKQAVESLQGDAFLKLQEEVTSPSVTAVIPKFSFDDEWVLNDDLKQLGMVAAFDPDQANFSKLADTVDPLYLSKILHKTTISIHEAGTMAGAVTSLSFATTSLPVDVREVICDRPFLFAIVDTETGLPYFIGIVAELG